MPSTAPTRTRPEATSPRRAALMLAAVLMSSGTPTASAQESAPADATSSPAVEKAAERLDAPAKKDTGPIAPRRASPLTNAAPAPLKPAEPGLKIGVEDIGVPTGGRLTEGKFLLRRPGRLVKAPTGEWVFAFVRREGARAERPVVLLPSSALARLEAQLGITDAAPGAPDADGGPIVMLSGQVFVYGGREYVLPTVFGITPAEPEPQAQPQTQPQTQPEPAADAPSRPDNVADQTPQPDTGNVSSDPGVADLIKDLEARRGSVDRRISSPTPRASATVRPGDAGTPDSGAPSADAPSMTGRASADNAGLVAEGTVLASRRGRIVRLSTGEVAFAIDNDAQSAGIAPMVMLPCRTLQRIEELFMWRGDALVLDLSGRVLTYQRRNYLLPTSFIVPVPSELNPNQ